MRGVWEMAVATLGPRDDTVTRCLDAYYEALKWKLRRPAEAARLRNSAHELGCTVEGLA